MPGGGRSEYNSCKEFSSVHDVDLGAVEAGWQAEMFSNLSAAIKDPDILSLYQNPRRSIFPSFLLQRAVFTGKAANTLIRNSTPPRTVSIIDDHILIFNPFPKTLPQSIATTKSHCNPNSWS